MVVCVMFLVGGCAKYTTPRKVEKRIVDGPWKISSFTINGENVAADYQTYTFSFSESHNVAVGGTFQASGSWQVGLDKNPTILYLNFPPVGGLEYLADDWQVTEMGKNRMTLARNDSGSSGGKLIFKR